MRLDTAEKRAAYRQAMIPQGAQRDPRSTDYAEVYTDKSERTGNYCARGFIGSGAHPAFNYSFRSEAQRETYITEFFQRQAARQDSKQARQAQKRAFVHSLTVGQLMSGSWGYDQTNAELWEVTRLVGKCSAELRRVKCRAVENSQGFMSERIVPVKGEYCERTEPVIARIQEGNHCRINRCCCVSPCGETETHYSSWYA